MTKALAQSDEVRRAGSPLTTATADTGRGENIRKLLPQAIAVDAAERQARVNELRVELRDVEADEQMAERFVQPGTWRKELHQERTDVWREIAFWAGARGTQQMEVAS